jgi:putative methionine-R-sulfoxide reductase with GAF domain
MSNGKQKTENVWVQRLMRFFKRDKAGMPKQKAPVTSETRHRRALIISLVIGVLQLFTFINYLMVRSGEVAFWDIRDIRVQTGLLCLACFISAWLARRKKSTFGIILILIVMYISSALTAFQTSGVSIVIDAFVVGLTLAMTAAVMLPIPARRMNIFSLVFAAFLFLLDVFEPFQRSSDPTPASTTATAIVFLFVFAIVIVLRFNTYNLRTKLIIAFAAVTIIPLLAFVFYTNDRLSGTLSQNARDLQSQFASETALQIDTFVAGRLTTVKAEAQNPLFFQFLSLSPAERAGTKEETNAQGVLAILSRQDTSFISAYTLIDKDGFIVLSSTNAAAQDNSQTQLFNQTLKENKSIITGPLINQKTGRSNLYFSAPVVNQAGVTFGVLVAKYNADIIEALVENLLIPGNPKQILFRVVEKNTFIRIANTDNPKLLYKSYQDFNPNQVASLQKDGLLSPENPLLPDSGVVAGLKNLDEVQSFTTSSDKTAQAEKYINSAVRLKNVPWFAIVAQPESVVLLPLVEQRRTVTFFFLILLIMITLSAFGLSQLLASPILSLAAVAQKIAAGDLSLQSEIESNDEIGTLAGAFNEMTRQTRALINSLEQRSKALATSSEVSRRISTLLDQQELVTEVVKQVQSAFNYYHAHIYILDENTQELVMAGGTGEAGKAMLARGHKIAMGKGLVGRAAQNNITVLVTDVSQESQWLPNPLLPETKSEVAVPIAIADHVLGVLDVQHNVADTLKQEDVDVLQSIANQVAFAVRNARSYSEVQAKADRESLITSISQKIQGTTTVESAMQVAIREIGRALNGAKTQITLNENSIAENIQQDKDTVIQS